MPGKKEAAMPQRTFAAHIEENADLCDPQNPWAVVDDDTGSLVPTGDSSGCYASREEAQRALDDLLRDIPPPETEAEIEVGARFEALLAVEGHETADGRMFELDSITWRDLPVPLMVQIETGPGGHVGAWFGGAIEEVMRDPGEASRILAAGHFAGPRADEAEAYVRAGLRGISVDVSGSEVVVEGYDPDEEGFPTRFLERYGDARIMGSTITPFAAFEETQIWLPDEMETPEVVRSVAGQEVPHGDEEDGLILILGSSGGLTAIRSHTTGTTDESWDGAANEARLPSPMSRSTAQNAYAWMSPDASGDEVLKTDCRFIHHQVGANGQPGVANLTACSTGIGVLNGGRGGTTIPAADRQGVYNHLAGHIRDGGLEPPPPGFRTEPALVAACAECAPGYRPPASFFETPILQEATALTIRDDGRIYGHIALWDSCHVGNVGTCLTPPRSSSGYAYFHTGEVVTEDGARVAVGHISMTTDQQADGHEYDLYANAAQALAHYDNTGLVVADVRAAEDRFGVVISGALRYGLPANRVAALRASAPSGDWRPIGTGRELIHILAVNSGGFPVPRARLNGDGEVMALVAAAAPHPRSERERLAALEREVGALRRLIRAETLARLDARARVRQLQSLDRRVGLDR